MNSEYKHFFGDNQNIRAIRIRKKCDINSEDAKAILLQKDFFEKLNLYLSQNEIKSLNESIQMLIKFFKGKHDYEIDPNFDLINLIYQCLHIENHIKLLSSTIILFGNLLMISGFVNILNNNESKVSIINQIYKILHGAIHIVLSPQSRIEPKKYIYLIKIIFKCFYNIAAESIEDRDSLISQFSIQYLFECIKAINDPAITLSICKLIHNYARYEIPLNESIKMMASISEYWHLLDSKSKIEIIYAINNLRPFIKIDWIKTIKKYNLLNLIINHFDLACPELTIAIFDCIFIYMKDYESFHFNLDLFTSLIQSENDLNIQIGCWAIENAILLDKTNLVDQLVKNGTYNIILNLFESSSYDIKVEAAFALCAFCREDLTNYWDVIINTEIIPKFLELFSSQLSDELIRRMLESINKIFEKAQNRGNLIDKCLSLFVQNNGPEIFEEFGFSDSEDISNTASQFLADFIDNRNLNKA